MGKYIIQAKTRPWEKTWDPLGIHEFDTLEEARAALSKVKLPEKEKRIAEAYTVVRYRPVK